MANGKIPGVRNVSKKETRELSKLPWRHDEALSTRGSEARVLPDGRVLLCDLFDGSGTLYPSREPLAKMQREIAEEIARGPVDPCLALLPPIADFIRDVEAHARSLGTRIGVADEALDGTVESLDAVDKALRRIPWAKRQVRDLVTPLVAYVGEVIRAASGGRWTTTTSRDHENEPMITAGNGRTLQPFALVFIPMIEPSKRIPLRSAVEVMVGAYRKPEGPLPPAA
jgi:hypothetical protein